MFKELSPTTSLEHVVTDECLLEEVKGKPPQQLWGEACEPLQQLRTYIPACHSRQTNYWLWETGQLWSGLVGCVCLLGALKTMLWHGRKTSPVSASAYVRGGNPSGVCAHVHLTLIWWPLLGCRTQELCWCMWPSVHCHAMTPHFPDSPCYLPLGECSSTNVSRTPRHNSLSRLDHFGYRKHRLCITFVVMFSFSFAEKIQLTHMALNHLQELGTRDWHP